MSKVNFLKVEYRCEPVQDITVCGIVDGENQLPAYTTTDISLKWNAVIHNPNRHAFQFIPIDNNIPIYKTNNVDIERRCDGMILSDNLRLIAFIELKDVRKGGLADAIEQLRITISNFLANHPYDIYRIRRAYAVNIAHPHFNYGMKDTISRFNKSLKFNLFITPDVTL